ncbi:MULTISPECIES: SMP-30/gluconolactonase/LRE family protein [unclassified Sphingomonas]|uniref:SMP-30/gluconolactonase/LRE family protein n=1 Tax=unclassified Sphingomonas TaxID=196159 RepID=UPI0008354ED0|nr:MULTISPECIES: SMP-30/gluconolactonase/LRE family protein [unclassified Sphingomonas]
MADWQIIKRDVRDTLGEGALWSARHNALYWTDILAPAVNRLSLDSGEVTRWPMPEAVGWLVERRAGGFIAGFKSGFAELDLDPVAIRPIVDPEPDLPDNRMNDGKADAAGVIWCGTMATKADRDSGSLWRFGADRRPVRMDSGYRVTNGPAFSVDGCWLYHSDTGRRTVYRFARRNDGTLGSRETFLTFAETDGRPDGMTIDTQDYLWIAHWGGSRVSRFRPDGVLDCAIALPASQVTNLTFGGARLDRLFVTSAAVDLPTSVHDGGLFEILSHGASGSDPGTFGG